MAFEIPGIDLPFRASANVTVLTYTGNPPVYSSGGIPQFSVVTPDTVSALNEDVIIATSTTVMPLGVAQDGPATGPGQSIRIRATGVSKCVAGAAVNYGDLLMVNASGQVITATVAGATSFFTIGKALESATAAGDIVPVQLLIGSSQYVAS